MADTISIALSDLIKCVEIRDWYLVKSKATKLKMELSSFLLRNYGQKDGAVDILEIISKICDKKCSDESKAIVIEMWLEELIENLSKYGVAYCGKVEDVAKAIRAMCKRIDELTFRLAPNFELRTSEVVEEEAKVASELDDVLDSLSDLLERANVNKTVVEIFEVVRSLITDARGLLRRYMVNPKESKVKGEFISRVMMVRDVLMKTVRMMEDDSVSEIMLKQISTILNYKFELYREESEEVKVEESREESLSDVLKDVQLPDWVDDEWLEVLKHPMVALIMGHTGQGKSALLYSLAEVMHIMYRHDVYMIWPDPEKKPNHDVKKMFPRWIHIIEPDENISMILDKIPNNSIAIIDEAFIAFGARTSMKDPFRPLLQKAIELKRHKNVSILFVSQRARNIDVSVLNGLDVLMIKRPQELQVKTDRSEIREYLERALKKFKSLPASDSRPFVYIIDLRTGKEFMKKFEVASFWNERISHLFA